MLGIKLSVLRSALGDCTNGGITAEATNVILIDDRIPESKRHYAPSDRSPGVRLTTTARDYHVLVPIDPWIPTGGRTIGPMAGGSYAVGDYGSGELWKQLTGGQGALPVHDRFETEAHYNAMSI